MVHIIVADNQKMIAAELEATGISVNLGWHHEVSVTHIAAVLSEILRAPARRAQMTVRGKAIVDGQGVNRVIGVMLEKSFLRAA